ncbi:MAG TPA: lysylphosphatidylglycerol synthase transmembrane domain-containing protein [Gaiellaceae bacterium]|nr:lysylphosphatidylglycerol synthase transmembrane domain-containing protein [Gaiellaceae bacterium]
MKLRTSKILISLALLAAITAAVAMPGVLGKRTAAALGSLHGADPIWLAVATFCFAAGFLTAVCAWRTALAASGGRISLRRGTASLGVGALVNTFAPARLGDAVKIALFSRAIDGPDPVWTAGGVYAAVAAARCLVIAVLVVAASLTGALPLWPVFALCGGVAALGAFALSSARWRRYPRLTHLLDGFAALERSPRLGVQVLAWSVGTGLARLAATAALCVALGLPHPLLVALLICPALDLAGAIPLTPGNIGVASGALAVVLHSRGIGVTQALGVGIAIQALETAVSLSAGTAGALYFARPNRFVGRWALRVAAVGLSGGLAVLLGAFFFDLT